jgi:IclR family transcriptional regulator, KDG regulon repressor
MTEQGLLIKSVVKAVDLLELVMASPEGITLKGLSTALGQNASTIYHLANTLRQTGMLQQDPETKAYRLGLKALQIGQAALQHLDLARRAQPFMRQLSRDTGEGVSLVQYEAGRPVYVFQIDSTRMIGMRHRPSASVPLHCTGSGKVYLSSLPDEELKRHIRSLPLTRFTSATITDPDLLVEEVRRVGEQGYAVDNEEVEDGLVCIAAPICNPDGQLVGSISLSGPSLRVSEQREDLIRQICETARSLSFQ